MRRPLTVGMSGQLRIPRLFLPILSNKTAGAGIQPGSAMVQMKNLLKLFTALTLVLAVSAGAYAKAPRLSAKEREKIEKENQKEAKKQAKEKKKKGWECEQLGSPETLILEFLNAKKLNGLQTKIETVEHSVSRSKARKFAREKAANILAQELSEVIKGEVTGMGSMEEQEAEERFVDQMMSKYAAEIAGMLELHCSFYKKNDDGTVDMEVYFLVDADSAQGAKLKAAKQALEKLKLNQEWADKISEALADIDTDDL